MSKGPIPTAEVDSINGSIVIVSAASVKRRAKGLAASRSRPSTLILWVQMVQLEAGIWGRETPSNAAAIGVALALPRLRFPPQFLRRPNPLAQALPRQHAQLDLGHVQPAAAARCVVYLQPPGQPVRFFGRERLIQRGDVVRVQV